jgi:membrane protein YdbS with pleckstrin-like domain
VSDGLRAPPHHSFSLVEQPPNANVSNALETQPKMNPEEVEVPKEPLPIRDQAAGAGATMVALGGTHGDGGVECPNHGTSPDSGGVPSDATRLTKEPVATPPRDDFQHVAGDFVIAERIAARIVMIVLAVGGSIAFLGWAVGLFATRSDLWHWGLWTICLVGFVAFLAFLGWFLHAWPAMEHRHLRWRLNAVGLEIQKGVWWQHRITVPRDRVQHVDVEQGPLLRRYGLAKLVVHTAGTHAPTIELPGLSMAVAQDLKNQLTQPMRGSHD